MSDALTISAAFLSALGVTLAATPVAIRIAVRTAFFDHPAGYKDHARPTPYLGGAAVLVGLIGPAAAFSDGLTGRWELIVFVIVLGVVGTIDDRVGLTIAPRLLVQAAAGVALWNAAAGWDLFADEPLNLIITVVWVVGIVNALNLMDNLDGASAALAVVSGLGIAALAITEGSIGLAALSMALAGACGGFLPYNLARPSRIFLGDGGSMPIGLVLAFAVMAVPGEDLGWTALLASVPLVGILVLDTTLVVISRRRRGLPVTSGARDHLTHRLRRLYSSRGVVAVLALAQGVLCVLAIMLHELAKEQVLVAGAAYLLFGGVTVVALERSARPTPITERAL